MNSLLRKVIKSRLHPKRKNKMKTGKRKKKKPDFLEMLKKWGPQPELADAVEKAYKQRSRMKLRDVSG